jgi:hypothetical protein
MVISQSLAHKISRGRCQPERRGRQIKFLGVYVNIGQVYFLWYKKKIKSTREFAINKFANDLLDVRDNLQMVYDFANKVKVAEIDDITTIISISVIIVKPANGRIYSLKVKVMTSMKPSHS